MSQQYPLNKLLEEAQEGRRESQRLREHIMALALRSHTEEEIASWTWEGIINTPYMQEMLAKLGLKAKREE